MLSAVSRAAHVVSLLVAASLVAAPLSVAAQTLGPPPNLPPPGPYPPPSPYPPSPVVVAPPPAPPEQRWMLRLESDTPGTEYRVFAGRREKVPWFQCMAPCSAEVPRGEYRFEATSSEMSDGSIVAAVAGPTRVTTEGGSRSAKSSGLVLGITGSAVAAIGLVGLLVESIPRCRYDVYGGCNEDPSHEDDRRKGMLAFGVVAAVGAVLATVGWVEFASNRTHMATQTIAPPPPTTTVGVAPTHNGAVIGASGFF
jgi:hypothetical protein